MIPDISELLEKISRSQDAYFTYGSYRAFKTALEDHCDIMLFELPTVDEHFQRFSYILRTGLPTEFYRRLDLGLMVLSGMVENVCNVLIRTRDYVCTYGRYVQCADTSLQLAPPPTIHTLEGSSSN